MCSCMMVNAASTIAEAASVIAEAPCKIVLHCGCCSFSCMLMCNLAPKLMLGIDNIAPRREDKQSSKI